MSDTIGDDAPPPHRGRVLAAVAVTVLAVLGAVRVLDAPPNDREPLPAASPSPAEAQTPRSASPTPQQSYSTLPSSAATYVAVNRPLPPPPWHDLPVVRDLLVDRAVGDLVVWHGEPYRLDLGDRALTMNKADGGPVLLVQSRGSTLLEQLRRDGSRLVFEAFHDDSRLPQGIAIDPEGRRVAYAVTNGAAGSGGRHGLVVRSLLTGAVVASRLTSHPFAVRGWVSSGVVLEVVADPAGPPYRWVPGAGRPQLVTRPTRDVGGPFLLAASPVRQEWVTYGDGCTSIVRGLGSRAVRLTCPELSGPAAYAPSGGLVAGLGYRPVLRVLDIASGVVTRLTRLRKVFVSQLVWLDDLTLLVAVHTLADDRGAVLECPIGAECRRAALGADGRRVELVLAE